MTARPAQPSPVAIVTGAKRGIGLELARTLLRRGYRVACLDLAFDDGTHLAAPPERVLLLPCDVRSDEDVTRSVDAVAGRWGRVDVLVNNAAVAPFGALAETNVASIQESFNVNVFGCVRTISAVLPVMRAQGGGTIANVASVLGFTGLPRLVGYASTKGAVEALTRSLAVDLASQGIAVKLLHAPLTRTPAAAGLGLPRFVMADPARVGRRLATRLDSKRTVVTADLTTAAWLLLARLAPGTIGEGAGAGGGAVATRAPVPPSPGVTGRGVSPTGGRPQRCGPAARRGGWRPRWRPGRRRARWRGPPELREGCWPWRAVGSPPTPRSVDRFRRRSGRGGPPGPGA